MIGRRNVVAIIPARGGSKGLPGKNIADLNGKPLIAYTIEAALKSRYIDKVVVTTDDDNIARISRMCGADVPFKRPKYLSGDTTHTPPAIEHAAGFIEKRGYNIDFIVTLQPTSPLRRAEQIDKAIKILHNSRFDSVLSVKQAEYPPYWVMRVKKTRTTPIVDDGTDYFRKERQQLPKTYQPNGAIYVTKRETLRSKGVIISKNCGVVVMDDISSLDVDTYEDIKRIREVVVQQDTSREATMKSVKERPRTYFYRGKKINLRGVEREDYTEKMHSWANDSEFNRYLSHGLKPTTRANMERLYNDLTVKENIIFSIVDKRSKKTIGIVGLHHFNWQTRSAEYTIHIGEKDFWGTGAASEATNFILAYAFNTLNLHKMWLGVSEPNTKALKFYERKGFVDEGRLRHEIFRENRYFDSIRMSILRREYEKTRSTV